MSSTVLSQKTEKLARQESLEAAFAYFNETSEQLTNSYRTLENKVQQLSRELDTSEAKRFEENKKTFALEQRMRALLDFLPGGVIVLNSRGVIVECNPIAEALLGNALKGKVWRHVITESFAPKNDDGLEVSTKTGKRLSISTSSLGEEGQILLLTDQTQTRQLQDQLSRNERLSAMGKMVSALAHQIRTPLSAAILYAGNLANGNFEPEVHQRFAEKCLGRLRHMEKQVRDMMLFVKSELPLNDIITIKELENELKAASEVALTTSNCRCQWRNDVPDLRVKCHRDALVSSLMNLINNAIQSGTKEVDIDICFTESTEHKDQIAVEITDNGDGMDADTMEKVQHMFTTTKSQGTGLGLAVVKTVAKAHGAEFCLKSKKGSGTTARMIIPKVITNTVTTNTVTTNTVNPAKHTA